MKIIGINIQRLRKEKNMTLREFSRKLGVSASFISQVETGKATPSLVSIKEIANSLGTTVGDLIGEGQNIIHSPVLQIKNRKVASRVGDKIRMVLLTSPDSNKQMEPLLFQLEKGAVSGESYYKHFGQEFVLVIKGCLEITLNDIPYVLKKGDTIYFNSNVPHTFKNIYSGETEALWVVTPPSF